MLRFLLAVSLSFFSISGIAIATVALLLVTTPRPTDIKGCLTTKMFEVRLCPTDSSYLRLTAISLHARNAVVVSEDAAFFDHHGFDWNELKVSLETNLEKGGFARGGSTISQQLAKNVYLTGDKSLLRKVREALITIQIEESLSKDEILEKYLNVVEFGPGLFGIGKASWHYFGKPASQLTAAEGAFLAFLLPSPTKHSASFRKKQLTPFARGQVREIVSRLHRFKKITDADLEVQLAAVDTLFGGSASPSDFDSLDFQSSPLDRDLEAMPQTEVDEAIEADQVEDAEESQTRPADSAPST